MAIPSGKVRNGDVSISSILLKRLNSFLVSLSGVYHSTITKPCSPNVTESPISLTNTAVSFAVEQEWDQVYYEALRNTLKWRDRSGLGARPHLSVPTT